MAASDPRRVEIKVIEGINLPQLGRFAHNDSFRVELSFGDLPLASTKLQKRHQSIVLWNKAFTFFFSGQMPEFVLEVHGKSSMMSRVRFVGRTRVSHTDLSLNGTLDTGSDTIFTCHLRNDNGAHVGKVDISTKITSLAVREQRADVEEALTRLGSTPNLLIPHYTGVDGNTLAPVGDLVTSLLKGIDAFADLIGILSEVHPYAKAAWSILDCVRQAVKGQIQQDKDLRCLAERMKSLYDRVCRVEGGLSMIQKQHPDILLRVARQTNDCAYFIVDYCKDEKFRTRAIKRIVSNKQSKIEEYQSAFANLTAELDGNVLDDTQEVVTLVWKHVHELVTKIDGLDEKMDDVKGNELVDKLKIVEGASLVVSGTSPKRCLTGTRVDLLEDITNWINKVREGSQDQRLLLLHGMAGTGKSSIAHTIASQFAGLGRLGASFAFSRRSINPRRVSQLFPHIARRLVDLDPTLKHHIVKILEKCGETLDSSDPTLHLEELIVEPLCKVKITGPIVIVIDALDEADEDIEQVAGLASLLDQHCGQLPSNVRILVASRPEVYILDKMQSPAILRLSMPDSSKVNMSDIGLFIRDQLLSRPLKGIDADCCDKLVETSKGLFQWAATACNVIKAPMQLGSTPRKGYEMVVTSGVGRDKSGLLDSLYSDVLKRIGDPDKNREGYELLMKVIAFLFALMEPMSLDAFCQLYKNLDFGEESDVDCTLPYLASILDGTSDADRSRQRHVQPNHTSLRDFFLDPERSGAFCVASLMLGTHDRAARSSFKIVSTLPQDAYGMDFTLFLNVKNEDLDDGIESEADRVQEEMPQNMEYATLYCVKHLAQAPAPEETFWIDLGTSLLTDNHALPWTLVFCSLAAHNLGHTSEITPELSGHMGLLAHIAKRTGSSCPRHLQSVIRHASRILPPESDPCFLGNTLIHIAGIYTSVAWIAKLQRRPKDGPLVTIGAGFFLYFRGASHDVILTTAHGLLDDNGCLHTDLVVNIPKQVPRLDGAWQFSDTQYPVLPADIHFCADFCRRKQLETDWAAIRLPRGTVLEDGFRFNLRFEDPDIVAQGTYGQPSWIDHHLHLPANNSNGPSCSVDIMDAAVLADPVTNGAPIYALYAKYGFPVARGIRNPTYGDNAYTKLTPSLTRELGPWLGFPSKSNIQLRWLTDSPDCNDLYLYVNEDTNKGEDSRLYLKHGSGSSFNISSLHVSSYSSSLGFGSRLVDVLDCDDEDTNNGGGRLTCVSASEHKGTLTIEIQQHTEKDQRALRETIKLNHMPYYFDVESTPIPNSSHSELELLKIGLQLGWTEDKPGSTIFHTLEFALES